MKTEGFLFDAGAPGFDPRFGYGVPVISKIMAWLKTPVGVMIFCALMAIQLPAQELTIQIAPKSGTITYQQADEAKVYPASGGVVIVSKGLSKQQGVGEIVIVDGATGPYGIFATDQSKIGFNPVPLILLEPDQWLILGVSGQKFMIVVTRFKDGVFTYDFKEVVIGKTGGDAPPPVDPPTDNLAEWQATARDRAVLVNDKPTAAALGASYIRNAALLTGVDLNEAYRRIEASTGDTLADRKGVSADVNWNVYLTYMEDKLQKAGVTTVGQYAKIVDAWGKGLLEASK